MIRHARTLHNAHKGEISILRERTSSRCATRMQAAVPGRQTHPSLPIHTKRRSNPHLLISLHEPSTQIAWHEKKICPHAPQLTHSPPPPQQQANVRPYTDRREEKMARGRTCGERRAHPPHSGPVCLAACGGGPRPTLLCDGTRRRRAERNKAVQREDGERTRATAGWARRGRRVKIPHPPSTPSLLERKRTRSRGPGDAMPPLSRSRRTPPSRPRPLTYIHHLRGMGLTKRGTHVESPILPTLSPPTHALCTRRLPLTRAWGAAAAAAVFFLCLPAVDLSPPPPPRSRVPREWKK